LTGVAPFFYPALKIRENRSTLKFPAIRPSGGRRGLNSFAANPGASSRHIFFSSFQPVGSVTCNKAFGFAVIKVVDNVNRFEAAPIFGV